MANALEQIEYVAKGSTRYQKIDGFGVNINSQYWDGGKLIPVMDLLVHDLGATLYRVDIYGKSNWVDPENKKDASILNDKTYSEIYTSPIFQNGWTMMRHLNEKGIQPYLTCSGDVSRWMLGDDGKTLVLHEQFCDMLVSLIDWAKRKEHLKFKYFGPLNETDIGSPEGPTVLSKDYSTILEILDRKLKENGLDDIRLVVAEQARFDSNYVREFVKHGELAERIGVFGMHTYSDISVARYSELYEVTKNTPYSGHSFWMSEYGDLDESGEKEWYVAWKSTSRLMDSLEAGFTGAMVWDAYDNYHDHDGAWTIYGLLRNARKIFTPKKRYYAAKQIYSYVLPGFERLDVSGLTINGIRVLGFANPQRTLFTVVGMNTSCSDTYIKVKFEEFDKNLINHDVSYYRTTENENCINVEKPTFASKIEAYGYEGIDVLVPAHSIFTLTNTK